MKIESKKLAQCGKKLKAFSIIEKTHQFHRIKKCLTEPKNSKGGPLDFFNHPFCCRKSKYPKRDPLVASRKFGKQVSQSRKNSKTFCIICLVTTKALTTKVPKSGTHWKHQSAFFQGGEGLERFDKKWSFQCEVCGLEEKKRKKRSL